MREETIQIYKFEELSEEAKQNAIERYRNSMTFDIESEFITEDFTEKLLELGYPTDDLEWRLSYSQGDGVAFYGDIDVEKVVKRLYREGYSFDVHLYNRIVGEELTIDVNIYRNSFGYHYSHFNTMEVEIDGDSIDTMMDYLYEDLEEDSEEYAEKYSEIEELLSDLRDIILTDVKEVSRRLEKEGYESLEYYLSDESITENIKANEYEFTADGVMY